MSTSVPEPGRRFLDFLEVGDGFRTEMAMQLEASYGIPIHALSTVALAETMDRPLLVIHDRDDRDCPVSTGRDIAEAWPGASFVETEGLGHRRILRDLDVIERVTSWVAAS
jgi:pimeloyl-ACP methyl ester carboxylesterase